MGIFFFIGSREQFVDNPGDSCCGRGQLLLLDGATSLISQAGVTFVGFDSFVLSLGNDD